MASLFLQTPNRNTTEVCKIRVGRHDRPPFVSLTRELYPDSFTKLINMAAEPNESRESKRSPAQTQAKGDTQQFAMAMELPFIIVAAVAIAGLAGYFLDRWLHSKPIFMLIFGAGGFFIGVRDVLRRLPEK